MTGATAAGASSLDPMVAERVRKWFVPLSAGARTLGEAHAELSTFSLKQAQVPWIVKLVENPDYDWLPGMDIFHGATRLRTHDHIHIVLGRGLMPKDEAFVVGFTMGSTDQVGSTEERLYGFFARHLYPRGYRFDEEDMRVFRDAVRLGFISACTSLATVDFEPLRALPIGEVRARLGIEEDLLRAYYAIEKRRFPEAMESRRLLD